MKNLKYKICFIIISVATVLGVLFIIFNKDITKYLNDNSNKDKVSLDNSKNNNNIQNDNITQNIKIKNPYYDKKYDTNLYEMSNDKIFIKIEKEQIKDFLDKYSYEQLNLKLINEFKFPVKMYENLKDSTDKINESDLNKSLIDLSNIFRSITTNKIKEKKVILNDKQIYTKEIVDSYPDFTYNFLIKRFIFQYRYSIDIDNNFLADNSFVSLLNESCKDINDLWTTMKIDFYKSLCIYDYTETYKKERGTVLDLSAKDSYKITCIGNIFEISSPLYKPIKYEITENDSVINIRQKI